MKKIGIKNIITGIFAIAAVFAFMIFSGVIKLGTDKNEARGTVTIWGTISAQTLQRYINEIKDQNLNVIYTQKSKINYENQIINSFASGSGPDLFMMSHEGIIRHGDKVLEIPYASFPKHNYEAIYVDEAELFLTDTGIIAFPVTIDPLLMYYNKVLISSAFILDIPKYWDEFSKFVPKITDYSGTGEIITSAASLGTYDNILNAKAIITSLILQNNNKLVGTDPATNRKRSLLALNEEFLEKTKRALEFYTSFADFDSVTYSWNEALVKSRNKFIAGEVALYFGRASEVENIRKKNPNLDFGVELLPQARDRGRLTEGAMRGIAISKQTKNIPASLNIASKISGKSFSDGLARDLFEAPARKDLLRNKPEDAFRTLVYNSAIISKGWLDADPEESENILRALVRNINTGELSIDDAISRAHADLNTLLNVTINTRIKNLQQ